MREVTDRIVSLDRARASLVQAIAAAGLGDVIKVTVAQRTIKVVGFLDRARLSRWSGIEEAFRRDFGNHVSLDTQSVTLSAAAPRGVHLGKDPFIILTDGSRLSIGDMLGVTGKIIAIQADKIRVRTASGDVDLPYAQTPNWIMEAGSERDHEAVRNSGPTCGGWRWQHAPIAGGRTCHAAANAEA